MSRRLQVFVSSTYLDLKDERQAAVEAILEAKHIPAGMELFAAGNDSQLEVIKRWIDESDVYMLILGHRYGSIEPKTGKSYTHVEYDYAVAKGKPVFAVVMTDGWRDARVTRGESKTVIEQHDPTALIRFRALVMERMCKQADDRKDIKIAVLQTLADFAHRKDLVGWVRGDADDKRQELEKENAGLKGELVAAQRQNTALEGRLAKAKGAEGPDWQATHNALSKLKIDLTANVDAKDIVDLPPDLLKILKSGNALNYFGLFRSGFTKGISASQSDPLMFELFHQVAPYLAIYDLVDEVSVPRGMPQRFKITKKGKEFLVWFDQQDVKRSSPKS